MESDSSFKVKLDYYNSFTGDFSSNCSYDSKNDHCGARIRRAMAQNVEPFQCACDDPIYHRDPSDYIPCSLACAPQWDPHVTSVGSDIEHGSRQQTQSTLMCVICKICSCNIVDSTVYLTCGIPCATELCLGGADATQCNYCRRKPKHPGYLQCSKPCQEKAKVACLLCRARPRNGTYNLCGRTCRDIAAKATPLIQEVPEYHVTYEQITNDFKEAWRDPRSAPPTIKRLYKVMENVTFRKPYETYLKKYGNEKCCYHGTPRMCTLGDEGNTKLCESPTCPVCNILRTSFQVCLSKPTGAFGPGIYTSTAPNKAYRYATKRPGGVVFLTKVVLGKVYSVNAFEEEKFPPEGYNSIVFDRANGRLNETVVYDNAAIRPTFIIVF